MFTALDESSRNLMSLSLFIQNVSSALLLVMVANVGMQPCRRDKGCSRAVFTMFYFPIPLRGIVVVHCPTVAECPPSLPAGASAQCCAANCWHSSITWTTHVCRWSVTQEAHTAVLWLPVTSLPSMATCMVTYTNTALCPLALVKSTVRIKFSSKMLFVFVFVSPPTGWTGCRWRHYRRVTRPAVSYALFYIY